MATLSNRIKTAWNAFSAREPTEYTQNHISTTYSYGRPDTVRVSGGNEKCLMDAVINKIALDCVSIPIRHVRVEKDDEEVYKEDIQSGLNWCMTVDANRDQSAHQFWIDVFVSLLDEGEIAIVPFCTGNGEPDFADSGNAFDIYEWRVAKVLEWKPHHVQVHIYDEDAGEYKDIWMPKSSVAIIENPFYIVMNANNSMLRRLVRKLALLDVIDEQMGSGKLDLIIQLPYALKTEAKKQQADTRRQALETQLKDNKLGIGYIDSTEKVIQLNRSLENNLLEQIEYLTNMLYSQLGITVEILNGTAEEEAMLNYMNRTVAPIMDAVVAELQRKFLTLTAYKQGQRIRYFNDPFKLTTLSQLTDTVDTFTRNEIASTNEVRTRLLGWKPVESQQADELRNKNINVGDGMSYATTDGEQVVERPADAEGGAEGAQTVEGTGNSIDAAIDQALGVINTGNPINDLIEKELTKS